MKSAVARSPLAEIAYRCASPDRFTIPTLVLNPASCCNPATCAVVWLRAICRGIPLTLCENGARRSAGCDHMSAEAVREALGSASPLALTPAIASEPIPEMPNACEKSGILTTPLLLASDDGGRAT